MIRIVEFVIGWSFDEPIVWRHILNDNQNDWKERQQR